MSPILEGSIKSKTIVLNGAVTLAGVLDLVLSNSGVTTALFPALAPYMALFGAVNVILRYLTKTSIADKVSSAQN
jgi:hypothetical protein